MSELGGADGTAGDAVLSIGSNLGDRLANLQLAVDSLRAWLVGVSPVFETAPWGPIEQDDFLNAIVLVRDETASPRDWLARAQAVEQGAGRQRLVRWGPRTLDVDVVSVDGVVSDEPALTLPHPRAHERAFVLVPWATLDPGARLGGCPVVDIIKQLSDSGGARRRDDLVLS